MYVPRIIRLLYYMYTNQKCYIKWANERSDAFSVANGVKQEALYHLYCLAYMSIIYSMN